MYVHVRQHPSVSWWVRRNEINTIPLVALAGVETEATISPWTAVAHRHPNLRDSVHSHTLPSLVDPTAAAPTLGAGVKVVAHLSESEPPLPAPRKSRS
jgi:hypothetical protein